MSCPVYVDCVVRNRLVRSSIKGIRGSVTTTIVTTVRSLAIEQTDTSAHGPDINLLLRIGHWFPGLRTKRSPLYYIFCSVLKNVHQ